MTKDELFIEVKQAMGIMTNYQDKQIKPYFNTVIGVMKNAGISDETIESNDGSIGVIACGVTDLWSYGAGNTKLSSAFEFMVSQLALSEGHTEESISGTSVIPISKEEIDEIIKEDF